VISGARDRSREQPGPLPSYPSRFWTSHLDRGPVCRVRPQGYALGTLMASPEALAALEMTRTALGLADDFANGIVAKRIIELARAGERHPSLLCKGALKDLRGHLFGD
jgi:hypothetical protein